MGYYGYYDTIGGYSFAYAPIVYAVVAVLAVILGVVLFFTMLRKKNEKKYSGFQAKIYHFLNVNKFYTEDIVRFLYVITVCVLTLVGLAQIVMGSFLTGLVMIVAGNVVARVSYECLLMFFVLVRKTVAIDRRLSKIEKFYGDDFDDGENAANDGCECGYAESESEDSIAYTYGENTGEAGECTAYDCAGCGGCGNTEDCTASECGDI